MQAAILNGFLLGLSLATLFGFGPALIALLQISIQQGFKSGFILALGVFLSDLTLVFLAINGSINIVQNPKYKLIFAIISSGLLAILGVITFYNKPHLSTIKTPVAIKNKPFSLLLKGYVINIMNPFVWLFWIGTTLAVSANNLYASRTFILIFFMTALSTVLFFDITKAYLAEKIKPYITYSTLIFVNRISGIALFLFGIFMVIRAIYM